MLVLLACAPESIPIEDDPVDPAPYIFEEDEAPAPSLTTADIEGAIAEALTVVYQLNGAAVFPAYEAAMVGSEENCPDYYEQDGNVYWYDQCTSAVGTSFSGYGFYQTYDGYDAGDGGLIYGEALYGVARIEDAEGRVFEAGGSAYAYRTEHPDYIAYTSAVNGAFAWDGAEADGTWLGTDLSPDIAFYTVDYPAYGRYVYMEGGLSGLGGEVDTVVTDTVEIASWSACPAEPGGVVSVRDGAGDWYDVVFDGPSSQSGDADPAVCDGCGEAYFRGEAIGAVCVDFTSLLTWEETPW